MIRIDHIDHFVLTVASIDATCAFYKRVLGMKVVRFESMGTPRVALSFGNQKINLHQADAVPDPNVLKPTPGSCSSAAAPAAFGHRQARKAGKEGIQMRRAAPDWQRFA